MEDNISAIERNIAEMELESKLTTCSIANQSYLREKILYTVKDKLNLQEDKLNLQEEKLLLLRSQGKFYSYVRCSISLRYHRNVLFDFIRPTVFANVLDSTLVV